MIVLLLDPQLKTRLGLQDILQDFFVQQILMRKWLVFCVNAHKVRKSSDFA